VAGNYPDVPGQRFEYDRDGSIVMVDGSSSVALAGLQSGNAEAWNTSWNAQSWFGAAWPEPRNLTGIVTINSYGLEYENDPYALYISPDTTNSSDGTFTYLRDIPGHVWNLNKGIPDACRRYIEVITGATSVRGIRLYPRNYRGGTGTKILHMYGNTPLSSNPDRLVLTDTNGTVITSGAYFDFGNAARNTTDSRSFRIKNVSAGSTAQSIAVAFEVLTNTTPSLLTQHQFNFGGSWVTNGNIGDLGPGAISGVIQFRRNTVAGAAAGPYQGRITAIPAMMT